MQCVMTVHFRILINGEPSVSFIPSRGLRQRDHLSPYLLSRVQKVFLDTSLKQSRKELGVV